MKMNRREALSGLAAITGLSACSPQTATPSSLASVMPYEQGRVDVFDTEMSELISEEAKISLLAEGFIWTEGPAWDSKRNQLYFSDIPNDRIHSWSPQSGLSTFLDPAGRADMPADEYAAPGTNGILYVKDTDEIIVCNQTARSIDVIDLESGNRRVLANQFDGKALNSPNDITRLSDGTLFFTDPPYGLKDRENFSGIEQPHFGVYRIDPNGNVDLVSDVFTRPNGTILSPDGRQLYVSQSDPEAPIVDVFEVALNGNISSQLRFADYTELMGDDYPGLPDGMAIDKNGFIFITGPGGVIVMAPDGRLLGRIYTGRPTANCAFGEDGSTLFMTAQDTLLSIPTKTKGLM